MTKYIAILRGINVGGKRKILMRDLKELFEELGFREVKTYIQSGNVIFDAEKEAEEKISEVIEKAIFERYGFQVPVICRHAADLKTIIAENPFFQQEETDVSRLHLTFLKEVPDTEKLKEINSLDVSPDEFRIIKNNVYLYCSGRYSDTKLSNTFLEKKLDVQATTRNWKTVLKLVELS